MFYPVHGELGSDPCAHAFLVMVSDTESNFRYKVGFFTEIGCKTHRGNKKKSISLCFQWHILQRKLEQIKLSRKCWTYSSHELKYSQVKRSQSSPCIQFHSLALREKQKQKEEWKRASESIQLCIWMGSEQGCLFILLVPV